ncbi:hypothetical protein [Pedobacter mucosus]|uniref:hypothetical protein n=1 Tax=Pedobacter mucosus TaxID=2895286 RepID=UPI001EE3C277|nr:hypothetical protein [Pedobacter mucosus]UKT64317.1 hypothetical protein LOK61_00750 [Pedobacter mucosus]
MTKTSTSKNNANLPIQNMFQSITDNESDAEIDLFYDQIKSKLDGLIKNPSEDVISKILAYSKR